MNSKKRKEIEEAALNRFENNYKLPTYLFPCDLDIRVHIMRDKLTMYLISEGYHSFEWESADDEKDLIRLTLYDKEFVAETELLCLIAAYEESLKRSDT